mgnify:CR=1 FL=1
MYLSLLVILAGYIGHVMIKNSNIILCGICTHSVLITYEVCIGPVMMEKTVTLYVAVSVRIHCSLKNISA